MRSGLTMTLYACRSPGWMLLGKLEPQLALLGGVFLLRRLSLETQAFNSRFATVGRLSGLKLAFLARRPL